MVVFQSYGVRVLVDVPCESVAERVRRLMPAEWEVQVPDDADVRYALRLLEDVWSLKLDGVDIIEHSDLDAVIDRLASDIHHRIALHARNLTFVHAGVVAYDGGAVILPGRSHSGKSTLVAALIRAGADYYSDEYAVFDDEGTVHPYPKFLSLRSDAVRYREVVTAEALGGRTADTCLRAHLVAFLTYKPGAMFEPAALSPAQTLLNLLDHAIHGRRHSAAALNQLARVVSDARAFRSERGEAEETAQMILHFLDTASSAGRT